MFNAVVGLLGRRRKIEWKEYFSLKFRRVKVELKLNVMKIVLFYVLIDIWLLRNCKVKVIKRKLMFWDFPCCSFLWVYFG